MVGVETRHSYPVDLRDGVLTIRCDSPAWTTTLTYMIPLLTDTIRRRLEGLTINEVRVTGPQQQGFSRGRYTQGRNISAIPRAIRRFVEGASLPCDASKRAVRNGRMLFPKAKKQG